MKSALDIYKIIKEGKLRVNCRGHFGLDYYDQQNKTGSRAEKLFERGFIELFIENVEHDIEMMNGANDDKWGSLNDDNKPVTDAERKEWNQRMRDHYKRDLEISIVNDHPDKHFFGFRHDVYCNCCGKIFFGIHNDELSFSNTWRAENVPFKDDCPMKNMKPFKTDFIVHDSLIVTNYFDQEDCEEDKKYADEYSINYPRGVYNVMRYKADKQKILYAQTGNSSVSILLHNDEKEILFVPCYLVEGNQKYKDYKEIGEVSMGVWRFEVANKKDVDLPPSEDYFDQDVVEIPIKHKGVWEYEYFEEYNQIISGIDDGIYAKLTFKQQEDDD